MTRTQAHQLLDAVRSGMQLSRVSHLKVRQALRVTGDLPAPLPRDREPRRYPNFGRTQ